MTPLDDEFEPLPPEAPAAPVSTLPSLEVAPAPEAEADFEPMPSVEEQAVAENRDLVKLFSGAGMGFVDVERRAGVLQLSRETGLHTSLVEASFDQMKRSWEASKFDPAAWRKDNPELAALVLNRPQLAPVVMRDAKLSLLSRALNKATELFFTPYVGESVPNREAELERLEVQRESMLIAPTKAGAEVDDNKARLLREGGPLFQAVIPIARYTEAKEHLEVSKKGYDLMAARLAGRDTYELEKQLVDMRRSAVRRAYGEGEVGQVFSDVAEAAASSVDVLKDAGTGAAIAGVVAGAGTYAVTRNPRLAGKATLKGASLGGRAGGVVATLRIEAGDAYLQLLDAKTDDGKPVSNDVATGTALVYGTLAAGIEFAAWGPMFKAMGPLGELIRTGEKKAALAALVKQQGFREIAKRVAKNWLAASAAEGGEEFLQTAAEDALTYLALSYTDQKLQAGPVVDVDKAIAAGQKGFVGGAGLASVSVGIDVLTQKVLRDEARVATQQVAAMAQAAESPTVTASPEAAAQVVEDATAKEGRPVTTLHVTAEEFEAQARKGGADPFEAAEAMMGPGGAQALRDALATGGKLPVPVATYLEKWVGTPLAAELVEHTTTAANLPTAAELEADVMEAVAPTPDASMFLAQRLANAEEPVDRGAEMYLDPVSGLRNRRAFDETPAPAGKMLAVITSPDVKAINDHPTAGGHDVANDMLRAMGRAIGEHDATAARSGTNFLVYVNDQADLDRVLERVRAAVGPQVALESGLGTNKDTAFASLNTAVETGRALGTIPPKGEASPGLDIPSLAFPAERAQSTVPPELAAKVAGLSPQDYFRQAYVTKGGLLTAEGFRAVPRKAHTAAFDMSGLGRANSEFGQDAGDKLLAAFEAAVRAAGGADFDAAHLSGDEFAAQSDDPAALKAFAADVARALEGVGVRARSRRTGAVEDLPVRFRHGVGENYAQADRQLNAARRAEQAAQAGGAAVRAPGADEARQAGVGREGGARPASGRDRRQAFPREVADDVAAAVASTSDAMGLRPIFRSAAEAGMTPEQWQQYLAELEEAHSHAAHAARLQAAKDEQRRTEREWKEREREERRAAAAEYEQLPARRAWQFLRGREEGDVLTMDRRAVEALVGAEAARRLPLRSSGGILPDDLADMFGFATGEELVRAMLDLPGKDEWVRDTAAARMAEKYPDALNDRARLRDLVSKGLHGEFTEKWLTKEWKALNARAYALAFNPEANRFQAVPNEVLGRPLPPAVEAKKTAAGIVSRQKIGRLSPGWALNLQRGHADKAALAAARGNYSLALVHKLQQLLAMHLWREVTGAVEQREAFYDLAAELGRQPSRARLGKASPLLRDGVDLVLEALGMKAPEERSEPLPSVADVVQDLVADGATVMFDEDVVARAVAERKPYRNLSVAEMREVDTYLRNVRAAARVRTTAIEEGKEVDREKALADLILEAETNRKHVGPVTSSESAETAAQVLGRGWNQFDGSGLRPERIAEWLGGNKPGSAWFRLVVSPLQKAKHAKADRLKKVLAPLSDKLDAALKDGRFMAKVNGKELFPTHREDLEAPKFAYQVFMMALHAGTQSSLDRLTEGRGITEEQLLAAVDKHLWKEAVELLQAVWDANESLWQEASALEERMSGVAPPKLEHRPLRTRFGTLRGGYMAAKYDARVEQVGELQLGEALGAVLDQSYVRPGTAKSHLKKRAENFSGALLLEPGLILRALDQVVHDIAYREALRSVAGLVWHPKLQRVMRERLGAGKADQFRQWLRDIGTQAGAQLTDFWSRAGSALKKRTVVSALAYRLPTALGDLSNYLLGARHLGPRALLGGVAEVLTSRGAAISEAYAKSGELRAREGQMTEKFRSFLELMTKRGGRARRLLDAFDRNGFTIFEWTEKLFAVPAWLGAYRKALREGRTEAAAVDFADGMVRRMLPAWNPVDQSAIQRNRYLSPFLMFASFHNVMWNELRDVWEPVLQAVGVKDKAKNAAAAVPATLFIIFSGYVVSELLTGRGPEPDDGEDPAERWAHWIARKMFVGSLMPLPVIGPELGTVLEAKVMRKRTTQRGGIYTAFWAPMADAGAKMLDGDKDGEEKFFALMRAAGPVLQLPTYLLTPAKYAVDTAQGETAPRGPGDVVGGAVYGAREGQPANVPTLLQDLAGE